MKFTKPFRGVPDGEIYPVDYEVGAECPPELEAGAKSLGAIGKRVQLPPPATLAAPVVQTSAPTDEAAAGDAATETAGTAAAESTSAA